MSESISRIGSNILLKSREATKDSQHGSRINWSNLTNLLRLFEEINKLVAEFHLMDVVYLEIQQASDKVLHVSLLKKIQMSGINEELVNQTELYFGNSTGR